MTQPTYDATLRSRFAQADWLAAETARHCVASGLERHPWLVRWYAGALGADDLQAFAAEHHHAVIALQETASRAAALADGLLADELERYAAEQAEAVDLFCEFAAATGWGRSSWSFAADPLPETEACAREWAARGRSLAEQLVVIEAVESALARCSGRQRDALIRHYGFDARSARYFTGRAQRSTRDAAVAHAGLTSLLPVGSPAALARRAETAIDSYGDLLGGVQLLCESPSPS